MMNSSSRFITHKLKPKVNQAKSGVAHPQERKILGFSFIDSPEIVKVQVWTALIPKLQSWAFLVSLASCLLK